MSENHLVFCAVLMLALLLAPIVQFLRVGWRLRFESIRERFGRKAIVAYYKQFHPLLLKQLAGDPPNSTSGEDLLDPEEHFTEYVLQHYGRLGFLLPGVLMGLLAGVALFWSAATVQLWMERGAISVSDQAASDGWALPELIVYALMGAYMWVLYDLIRKCRGLSLHPSDLYWGGFRFALAAPTAAAIAGQFPDGWAAPSAFLLGTFPTHVLFDLLHSLALKSLGIEPKNVAQSELSVLQSVDARQIRAFADQGVTTNVELAYADPIHLTVRTGLDFVYVMDCASQALLWIYLGDGLGRARGCGLRGALEMSNFYDSLYPESDDEQADGVEVDEADEEEDEAEYEVEPGEEGDEGLDGEPEALLACLVASLPAEEAVLRNIAFEVWGDPQTEFLRALWDGPDLPVTKPDDEA